MTIPWLYFLKYTDLSSLTRPSRTFCWSSLRFSNVLQHLVGYCSRHREAGFTVSRKRGVYLNDALSRRSSYYPAENARHSSIFGHPHLIHPIGSTFIDQYWLPSLSFSRPFWCPFNTWFLISGKFLFVFTVPISFPFLDDIIQSIIN